MTGLNVLGVLMLVTPFVVMFVLLGRQEGWRVPTMIYASVIVLFAWIAAGSYLLTNGG